MVTYDYLNAKEANIKDATFTELAVNTKTLYVDSTNDRVGIGTANPSAKLQAEGKVLINNTATDISDSLRVNHYAKGWGLLIDIKNTLNAGRYGVEVYSNAMQDKPDFNRIYLDSSSSTANAFKILNKGTGNGLDIEQVGNGIGLNINNTSTDNSLEVNTTHLIVDPTGNVGIGTASPTTDVILDVSSTTKAFMPPRMTTTQRNALTASNGMMIYNTTTNQFEGYENGSWVDL